MLDKTLPALSFLLRDNKVVVEDKKRITPEIANTAPLNNTVKLA